MGKSAEVLAIALPPAVSKRGKTTGELEHVYAGTERLKLELGKRRFALKRNPEVYGLWYRVRDNFQADRLPSGLAR